MFQGDFVVQECKLLIGGKSRDSSTGETFDDMNPGDSGKPGHYNR